MTGMSLLWCGTIGPGNTARRHKTHRKISISGVPDSASKVADCWSVNCLPWAGRWSGVFTSTTRPLPQEQHHAEGLQLRCNPVHGLAPVPDPRGEDYGRYTIAATAQPLVSTRASSLL
jgi:hypothetical protein